MKKYLGDMYAIYSETQGFFKLFDAFGEVCWDGYRPMLHNSARDAALICNRLFLLGTQDVVILRVGYQEVD